MLLVNHKEYEHKLTRLKGWFWFQVVITATWIPHICLFPHVIIVTSFRLSVCVYVCMCEMVSAVSVCRGRGAGSAPWRAGSRASGPEELAERQSSYFPYTSSHIQTCSTYLTKHLHPAVQQQHKRRWGRTTSLCVCLHVRVWEWVTFEN